MDALLEAILLALRSANARNIVHGPAGIYFSRDGKNYLVELHEIVPIPPYQRTFNPQPKAEKKKK